MELEYDEKFEEMKKYIPFLESMIQRLESTSSTSGNPRQAQLDKIRSLRDLLLNKKKRMKMENLLKCEQVLINLYAKVEQKDYRETILDVSKVSVADSTFSIESPTLKEKSDLEAVRNKLKTVTKIKEEPPETLPEILSRNEIEEVCTSGTKEPALFQRRPNRSPTKHSLHRNAIGTEEKSLSPSTVTRRSYTRVLVSPEPTSQRWVSPGKSSPEKPLFSRRSPRRSPRRHSPSYYKRERKKSFKESQMRKAKDLNITLNVPEDSLNSLNNTDLLPRILNCSDDDVDIDTLRELRKQILGELKKTGATDDISDLLLQSFKNKSKSSKKAQKKQQVEEGELSDSESETIDNVYRSLIVKEQNLSNTSNKSGKIQICLVMNPDKHATESQSHIDKQSNDFDLEMYDKSNTKTSKVMEDSGKDKSVTSIKKDDQITSKENSVNIVENDVACIKPSTSDDNSVKTNTVDNLVKPVQAGDVFNPDKSEEKLGQILPINDLQPSPKDNSCQDPPKVTEELSTLEESKFKANFYKPILESNKSGTLNSTPGNSDDTVENSIPKKTCEIEEKLEELNKSTEIPLLNEPTVANPPDKSIVSEIDILQALKNEILSETISLPGQEVDTPLLHQPKVVKVASAQEILPKKRISIEKYKQKAVHSPKQNLDKIASSKDDNNHTISSQHTTNMKTSLKLTEKECERFQIPKISFDEDSFDDDDESIDASDIYSDLAPKSPDHEESTNLDLSPPVIIPVDPIQKTLTVNHKADIDMRALPMLSQSNIAASTLVTNTVVPVPSNNVLTVEKKKIDSKVEVNKQNRLIDPRVRRDFNPIVNIQSPNPHTSYTERTPRPPLISVTPSPASNPVMTPNARSYEMTPTHQTYEIESSSRKHVYVPAFSSSFDACDRESSVSRDRERETRESRSRIDEARDGARNNSQKDNTRFNESFTTEKFNKGSRNDRYILDKRDDYSYNRSDCPNTPVPSFGRSDISASPSYGNRSEAPMTPNAFGRITTDCPSTPSHPFGRSECPPTPSHSFGRSDCPPTLSHHFGRLECPTTPSHAFGRSDCPPTPSHGFGRSDCPPTPTHSFGRTDGSQTPNHPFARSETVGNVFGRADYNTQIYNKDPRLYRKPDYESNSRYDERDRGDKYRGTSFNSQNAYSGSDSYRNYEKEQGDHRNSRYRYYKPDRTGRKFNRDQSHGESSAGPPSDRHYAPDQSGRHFNRDSSRRESSVGPFSDRHRNRERGWYDSSCEEVGSRRDGKRESVDSAHSVSGNIPTGSSKTLSVKPEAGRSFRIDTSVNTTFQNFLENKGMVVFDYSFDARRQRAGSVGRSLVRETSVGRMIPQDLRPETDIIPNKRDSFKRAASVGRDLAEVKSNKKSFQEIKADFKSCKFLVKDYTQHDVGKKKDIELNQKNNIEQHGRSRKDIYEKNKSDKNLESSLNSSYSPRKNNRDPRMRKESIKHKRIDTSREKKTGIVYSNDNIVKGAILSTGYGVKNYKIPKIKRVVEEKPPEVVESDTVNKEEVEMEKSKIVAMKRKDQIADKEKISDGRLKEKNESEEKGKTKIKSKDITKENQKTATISQESNVHTGGSSQSDETIERRQTRSRVKKPSELQSNVDEILKTKKTKKVIYDSESETEKDQKDAKCDLSKPDPRVNQRPVKLQNIVEKQSVNVLDNTFEVDELEMFTDNAVSDPVIDSIDDLIADLDKDLHASKTTSSDKFTKEISLENMLLNITSPRNQNTTTNEETLNKSDVKLTGDSSGEKNQLDSDNYLEEISNDTQNWNYKKDTQNESNKESSDTINIDSVIAADKQNLKSSLENASNVSNVNHEDIVSTTEINKKLQSFEDKVQLDEQNIERCSTPDSTNRNVDVLDKQASNEGLADSTNEVHCETNVSSTQSVETQPSSSKEVTPALDPISNLLMILQDKSKIKELLSILGDQSGENEKIKKKLEKLSEIVSDDEDDHKNEMKSSSENNIESEGNSRSSILEDIDETNKKKNNDVRHDLTVQVNEIGDVAFTTNDDASKELDVASKTDNNESETDNNENKTNNSLSMTDNDVSKIENEASNILDGLNKTDKTLDETRQAVNQKEICNTDDKDGENDNIERSRVSNEPEITETEPETDTTVEITEPTKNRLVKKTRMTKKIKAKVPKNNTLISEKRVTRATAAVHKPKIKKKSELLKLQEDIKEMFLGEDGLSVTGIRMCRLAKLVDEKLPPKETPVNDTGPVVVLEKHCIDKSLEMLQPDKSKRKKPIFKPKPKVPSPKVDTSTELNKTERTKTFVKYKPGPKSKTKSNKEVDPYAFETDSVGDINTGKASEDEPDHSSDSEDGSLASYKSFGSSELLADIKKKTKRKRKTWQIGVIKPKGKKKRSDTKQPELNSQVTSDSTDDHTASSSIVPIPDTNCFTDKSYCFRKNESTYACWLCMYKGQGIVHHYKQNHPHVEIPLSRMAPLAAKEAIDQCKEIDFQAIGKVSSDKYVCIFCFKEFVKKQAVLETFFWHIVSTHTGEYKQLCSECDNVNRCPFTLDIPPPPKDIKGQLIGYICKKCNFTQISLENLKTHVIVRHNDEQTVVYTINLSAMNKKTLKTLLKRCDVGETSIEESPRTNPTKTEITEEHPDKIGSDPVIKSDSPQITIQSKITFEADDNVTEHLNQSTVSDSEKAVKLERIDNSTEETVQEVEESSIPKVSEQPSEFIESVEERESDAMSSDDIVDYPHFKMNITESGAKEYICCINKEDNHFKTTLLISMKKHVQIKHSEMWDGFCFVCKVIVTPQGKHQFKECLQHYLDKHIDSFPILEKTPTAPISEEVVKPVEIVQKEESPATKPYINVRPLSQLISKAIEIASSKENDNFPMIKSVVSLGVAPVEPPRQSPSYPTLKQEKAQVESAFKYEEVQADVMSKKHRVVLESMMCPDRLTNIYKCAGRFCSFTSDSAEKALLHASTHQRIGGVDALRCSYCNFNPAGNAIDLVMHVFKYHGMCQYSCGKCFYRAAASQSVEAHMTRVHKLAPGDGVVLRTTAVTSTAAAKVAMMTRDQAVLYYVCCHVTGEDTCKYRTYTPDKFGDHLQQRHSTATVHPCYLCGTVAASPAELIQHMKVHGLKLYQCTWCVHGADNEAELLAHVSIVHPSEQPQAYLRIVTNKDGSSEQRVLPLAFLNKKKVPTEDVISRTTKEDPVREAERSIELEKLIGQLVIEPVVSEPPEQSFVNNDVFEPEVLIMEPNVEPIVPEIPIIPAAPVESAVTAPSPNTSRLARQKSVAMPMLVAPEPQTTPAPAEQSLQGVTITPMKRESKSSDAPNADIVVLDSDDEDTTPDNETEPQASVIDLSDEDDIFLKVPLERVNKCPWCFIICKNLNGLKRHIFHCYPKLGSEPINIQCPHCKYVASNKEKLYSHYLNDHRDRDVYECGVCQITEMSLSLAKKHVQMVHNEKNLVVSSTKEKGGFRYLVNAAPKIKVAPKRKLSSASNVEPPPEQTPGKRRFTPEEMDQLPVNAVLGHAMQCEICGFSTKVRWNMVRHLQLHLDHEPAPQTVPVNPVPHLESNEMHFDRMLNLASSSLTTKSVDKPPPAPVSHAIAADAAARYPRYVAPRLRYTCGARACAYISLDEAMLKCHWDTLHADATVFHCVHCPPNQTLDTTKPLTAARILSHLKMHDATLFACSSCSYYHFKKEVVEKHLSEVHKTGRLLVVREELNPSTLPSPSAAGSAPTMDLKAWQCGFCQFKSMLRPEVVEHCTKYHQSKMQFRCGYCPYRASAIDNVKNHLSHSHADQPEEILHYYYKEGSLPEVDGVPRWVKQRHKLGTTDTEVKTETEPSPPPSPVPPLLPLTAQTPPVDLNLVKKEVEEVIPDSVETIDELCRRYGAYCDPNGIKFKCPLCKIVSEDTKEEMQSHLYEELKYRKWGCGLCTYKAFHRAGLVEHLTSEHRRRGNISSDQIELAPTDPNIEKWVAGLLDHQTVLIEKLKTNFAKQKIITEKTSSSQSTEMVPTVKAVEKYSVKCLKDAFGDFGAPTNKMYCCPKCNSNFNDEAAMRDHLEMELNKIRWCCSKCPNNFQTYHEAQFHCKIHDGSARPKEAMRQPAMRAAWISNIIQSQRKSLLNTSINTAAQPSPEKKTIEPENSLLVVRYEEKIPTLEKAVAPRKRSREALTQDGTNSDDESEDPDYGSASAARKPPIKRYPKDCYICGITVTQSYNLRSHILRKHFNLHLSMCGYCPLTGNKQTLLAHLSNVHPGQPVRIVPTPIPETATALSPHKPSTSADNLELARPESPKLTCLVCSKSFSEIDTNNHKHDNVKPDFAKKGDVVVKCCICLALRLDVKSLQEHHSAAHPETPINYALFKLHYDTREIYNCGYCKKGFKFIRDLKSHHNAVHATFEIKYTRQTFIEDDIKRNDSPVPQSAPKRCARKSTTKLPCSRSVAKKSTTKLPYSDSDESSDEEYSFYGQSSTPLSDYSNVTTLMSFCNTLMPFTLKKLSEIIKIEPKVVVKDMKTSNPQ